MAHHLVQLATRAKRGDRPALEELLQETASLVHALARARFGDSAIAETVTANALTRVASGLARLRDAQAYSHWVYRITQRCIARQGGKPRARGSADPSLPDQGAGPADTLVAVERRRTVRAAIEALPAKLREPVLLHFTCGMAYREIAGVLGTGLGTVSRRMRKALAALEARLGDEQ